MAFRFVAFRLAMDHEVIEMAVIKMAVNGIAVNGITVVVAVNLNVVNGRTSSNKFRRGDQGFLLTTSTNLAP